MGGEDLMTSIPAWGIFAFFVIKFVLDWSKDKSEKEAERLERIAAMKRRKSDPRATPEAIAAVIRDQDERRQVLDLLRHTALDQGKIVESLDRVSAAMERIAATQEQLARAEETQSQILQKQAERSREIADSIADTRRIVHQIREDTGRFAAQGAWPPATT